LIGAGLRDAVLAGGIEAPLEHVAIDDERPRDLAVSPALLQRARVDQQATGVHRRLRLLRLQARQLRPGFLENAVDRAHTLDNTNVQSAVNEGDEEHWDDVYARLGPVAVSWYQPEPTISLTLIERLGLEPDAAILDVGGGASTLVDRLVSTGFRDVTVLDVSRTALELAQARVGPTERAHWVHHDIRSWMPRTAYDVWHDRAVFHFMVNLDDRDRYLVTLNSAVRPGGHVIIATFASDGPDHCSGLPVLRCNADDIAAALGPRFTVVDTVREEHTTPAAVTQPFTWVLARAGG
jgi:2-polyprenyl-3-methyl-5-hydroxy-6-metoxy-1,4-benzoquinol methylase